MLTYWQKTSQLAIFVKHDRPVLLSNVNQGQVLIKGELDLGTDLKSGLNIAVYYDVTWKSGNTLELFIFWPKIQRVTCSSVEEELN